MVTLDKIFVGASGTASQNDGHSAVILRKSPGGDFVDKIRNGTIVVVLAEDAGSLNVQVVDEPEITGWAKKCNIIMHGPDYSSASTAGAVAGASGAGAAAGAAPAVDAAAAADAAAATVGATAVGAASAEFLPEVLALPADFDECVQREATEDDFSCQIGQPGSILTYLVSSFAIRFVSGQWLLQQADSDQPLPRRQDLPADAFLQPEKLFNGIYRTWTHVVALSYAWIRSGHPDPERWHLQSVLQLLRKSGCRVGDSTRDVAVFWDWLSLDQVFGKDGHFVGRTAEENRRFKAALSFMHVVYGHEEIAVWRLDTLPAGVRPIHDRGWPTFEHSVFTTARKNDHGKKAQVLTQEGRVAPQPPIVPDRFAVEIAKKSFTGKGDVDTVIKLYASVFDECFCGSKSFEFNDNPYEKGWGDQELYQLASFFRRICTAVTCEEIGNLAIGRLKVLISESPTNISFCHVWPCSANVSRCRSRT